MMETRIIVYTCITNGKDTLKEYTPEPGLEYMCFTDGTVQPKTEQWKLLDLRWDHEDPRRIARYHKLNPSKVLPDHDWSCWMDGCMVQCIDIKKIVEWLSGSTYAARKHPGWNCIYREAMAVVGMGLDSADIVQQVVDRYTREGFPAEYGLHETNVLIRRNCAEVNAFDSLWWSELDRNSKRDQLSFDYVRWKTGMEVREMERPWFAQVAHLHEG